MELTPRLDVSRLDDVDTSNYEAVFSALRGGPASLEGLRVLFRTERATAPPSQADALRHHADGAPSLRVQFERRIWPHILDLARSFDSTWPYLSSGTPGVFEVSRLEAARFLALMFLGAVPGRRGYPSPDFGLLLSRHQPQEVAKLRCFIEYFDRTIVEPPQGNLRIERLVLDPVRTLDDWLNDDTPLTKLEVHDTGTIEDAHGCLQVDFANAYLGGGVLVGGCVQEEIRFAVCPELVVAMPICEAMASNEAIRIRGAPQYCDYEGYAFGLRYGGAKETLGAPEEITAIDAIAFRDRTSLKPQLEERTFVRELNKAFIGFACAEGDERDVATGNWGCGAFNGHHQLKAILQWAAASAAGRSVHYYTFSDARIGDLAKLARLETTVGGLLGATYGAPYDAQDLYEAVLQRL